MPLILPNGVTRLGAGPLMYACGFKLHNVADEVVARNALGDLAEYTETDDYFAAIAFRDGRILLRPALKGAPPIPEDVAEKLIECASISNRDIHHDGHWLWAAGDGYLTAIYRDAAGDVWLTNTFSETWARIRAMSKWEWVNILEKCWAEAKRRYGGLELKQNQIIRASAGSLVH